jgi:hypothetical protein
MTPLDLWRFFLEFCYFMVLYQSAYFVFCYIKVLHPLKDKIKAGDLVAPPKWTTLAYHLAVAYLVVIMAGGTLYSLGTDAPFNPSTVLLVPGLLALFFILQRFRQEYVSQLSAWAKDSVNSDP